MQTRRSWSIYLAGAGLALFLLGLALLAWLWRGTAVAGSLDDLQSERPPLAPVENVECILPLTDVRLASRVMGEHESQALTVLLNNQHNAGPCRATVTLAVGNFNISPPVFTRTVEELPPGESQSLTWVLSPQRPGSFVIVIATDDQVQEMGLTVTTLLGLTAGQARLLSLIGSLLGPMLTLPWWLERWEKSKKRDGVMSKDVKE